MGYVNMTGKCYSFDSIDNCKAQDYSDKSDIYMKVVPAEPEFKWRYREGRKCRAASSEGVQTFGKIETFYDCAFKCGLNPEVKRNWETGEVLEVAPECNSMEYDAQYKTCNLYEYCNATDAFEGETTKLYDKQPFKEPTTKTEDDTCNEELAGTNGTDYRGCQTQTNSGKTCQRWDTQSPQSHSVTPANHPDAGLDDNYCRNVNPAGASTIWCYTTDPATRWEYCTPVPPKS